MSDLCWCEVSISGLDSSIVDKLLRSKLDNNKLTMSRLVSEPFKFIDNSNAYILPFKKYYDICVSSGSKFRVNNYSSLYELLDSRSPQYFRGLVSKEIVYNSVGKLDLLYRDFNWYTWRIINWGTSKDVVDTSYADYCEYGYTTVGQANIRFWEIVTRTYNLTVTVTEENGSSCLFNRYVISRGCVTSVDSFSSDLDLKKLSEGLTDREIAQSILDKYCDYNDYIDSCDYLENPDYFNYIDKDKWVIINA